MSTSGTVTFRLNRDQLITQALIALNVLDPENTSAPTANQTTNASNMLNLLVKGWEANGLQLWERKWAAIFPQENQQFYALGSPGPSGDYACLSSPLGTGFVITTVVSSAGTALTVGTTTGYGTAGTPAVTISNGYYIGIQQTDGTLFWTTVNGAPVGNNVTLTAAPSVGALVGGVVYCFQTKMIRPLQVLDGFLRQNVTTTTPNDIPCYILTREEYNRFGMKGTYSTSTQLYYDPQRDTGYLYVYPAEMSVNTIMYIECTVPIQDFTSSTDDFDLPQEWGMAIVYNLALMLAPTYSVPKEKFQEIQILAQSWFKLANDYDQEYGSVYFQPYHWVYSESRYR